MESAYKTIRTLAGLAFFLLCCALVILGQKQIGWGGIGMMLLGLGGILLSLWLYNVKNR